MPKEAEASLRERDRHGSAERAVRPLVTRMPSEGDTRAGQRTTKSWANPRGPSLRDAGTSRRDAKTSRRDAKTSLRDARIST
jgi:hypothetical protein